jgi:3,4-dihydroxy 2-butanone 4-phosphate synthase/GTP cyclohydrolase II
MQIIADEGRGAVLLFRDPYPRLRLSGDTDEGPRTVKRTGLGAQIMAGMGLHELILLTDNPETRYLGLDAYSISIVGTRPITTE